MKSNLIFVIVTMAIVSLANAHLADDPSVSGEIASDNISESHSGTQTHDVSRGRYERTNKHESLEVFTKHGQHSYTGPKDLEGLGHGHFGDYPWARHRAILNQHGTYAELDYPSDDATFWFNTATHEAKFIDGCTHDGGKPFKNMICWAEEEKPPVVQETPKMVYLAKQCVYKETLILGRYGPIGLHHKGVLLLAAGFYPANEVPAIMARVEAEKERILAENLCVEGHHQREQFGHPQGGPNSLAAMANIGVQLAIHLGRH